MAKVKRNVKRKYDNIDDLITKIDNYFNDCDLNSVPYTIPGLALYLDFPSTEALWNFEHRDRLAGCGDAIKKAKLRVENQLLNKAITSNAAGSMFTGRKMITPASRPFRLR